MKNHVTPTARSAITPAMTQAVHRRAGRDCEIAIELMFVNGLQLKKGLLLN